MTTEQEIKQRVLESENSPDKVVQAMFYTYKRMFEIAGGNFVQLVKDGKIIEGNRVEIPFGDYEISQDDFDLVINETIKKFKLKTWKKDQLRNAVLLGCSPKIKK